VAEHRRFITLSRVSVLAVALLVAGACLPTSAGAQSTGDRIAQTRAQIDKTASEWFSHTAEAEKLRGQIDQLEQRIATDQAHAERVAEVARGRALEIYIGTGNDLAGVLDADNALDSARRAELLDRASADGRAAIDELDSLSQDLKDKRAALEQSQSEQEHLSAELAQQKQQLESQLSALTAQASREAAAARAAAATRAAQQRAAAAKRTPKRVSSPPASASVDAPAPAVAASGGSHHDEPFLVCTRARESGGNNGAVNGAGYYGAYQFAPTTWNITASHAGRLDLIGVLPSQAAPSDQDELAWVLYQWRGNAPWGGRC
jgi:peptidoglycan hydrolase CwlO-like protein